MLADARSTASVSGLRGISGWRSWVATLGDGARWRDSPATGVSLPPLKPGHVRVLLRFGGVELQATGLAEHLGQRVAWTSTSGR